MYVCVWRGGVAQMLPILGWGTQIWPTKVERPPLPYNI